MMVLTFYVIRRQKHIIVLEPITQEKHAYLTKLPVAIESVFIMQAVLFLFICHTLKHASVYESFKKHTIHTVQTKLYLTSDF